MYRHKTIFVKYAAIIVFSLVIIALLALLIYIFPKADVNTGEPMMYYGHRGFSSQYPENTLPAYTGAFDSGFDGLEIDVWESRNGDLMVHHDATLNRMCGTDGWIWDINTTNREQYPITGGNHIEDFSEHPLYIPTLSETLRLTAEHNKKILIHLKAFKDVKSDDVEYELSDRGMNSIIQQVKDYGLTDDAFIFCSNADMMSRFQGSGLHFGRITGSTKRKKLNKMVEWCVDNGADTLLVTKVSCLSAENVGKDFVKACHDNGIRLGVYTVKTKEDALWLDSIGVDFIMTNYDLK